MPGRKPYNGQEPYIFVSYPHANMRDVLPIIDFLQDSGYRVWFDEGIDPGTEWHNSIADRIMNCAIFIAMISPEYIDSQNCCDEVNFARDNQKKVLCIYVRETKLPNGLQMRLGSNQAIHVYRYRSQQVFFDRLLSISLLSEARISPNTIQDVPYTTEGLSSNPFYLYNDYCNYVGACFSFLCSQEGAALVQAWCKEGLQELAETRHFWDLDTPQDCSHYLTFVTDDQDLGLRFTPLTFEEWITRCHECSAFEEHWSFSWNSSSSSTADDDDYMDYDEDQVSLMWHIEHILDEKPSMVHSTSTSCSTVSDRHKELTQSVTELKQAYNARKDQHLYCSDLESAIQAVREGKYGALKTAQLNPKYKQAAMDNVDVFARYFAKQRHSNKG